MSDAFTAPAGQQAPALPDHACYQALLARDARFDGLFFTGVSSTGIYCRPVCSAKTPRRENCRFFRHAAQAEHAGFRPCLRCRPELAPQALAWSSQDASATLAHQAARLLDEPEAWPRAAPTVASLALRLGISARHLRRIFETHFGVSPMRYLQTRRLHIAKQLITDTRLPATRIAAASGYASVRRFHAEFLAHYRLNPTQLRRKSQASFGATKSDPADTEAGAITMRLAYRPPYDTQAMLDFSGNRIVHGIEMRQDNASGTFIGRTLRIVEAGQAHCGWLRMRFDAARLHLVLQVGASLREVLPLVIRRVRAAYDLDADPRTINAALHADFPSGDGLRVPGTLDGFELAVRAVLGQQVTVAAARTMAERLVRRFGEPIATPFAELTHLFPTPQALAAATSDELGALGVVRQRQAAIAAISREVTAGTLELHPGAPLHATLEALKALPGIGDWTAQYIAMRALRWPDAFPAGDVALQKALGVQHLKQPARLAEAASAGWKPWRSYAVIRVWSGSWKGGAPHTEALALAAASRPATDAPASPAGLL
jgi:AraC family transcriptional regulator, regulatory protein of adaptative response / DNA-3-methyladenine glycosylase II